MHLAAQCEIPPPYRAIPFQDSIAEGGIAPICLVFTGYRASIAEIPPLWGGYRTSTSHALQGGNAQKRGRGYRTQFQKTREGCGCQKFLAGKVFGQISTLLENSSPIFRQHEMLSLPRFGHFPARKTAAGKLAAPSGTLLDFRLRDRHSLLEFF